MDNTDKILYVVGTPIGNMGDMSPRAVETLSSVDFIAAEDTRVTLKLLNHFGVKKPMVSYFEHNKHDKGERIIDRILAGESCAVVTDAGMPCISDPGELLVKMCAERGIKVEVVPGPSAVVSALAISGLGTKNFQFEGFLSVTKKQRNEHLAAVKNSTRTLIFYEAPHKLLNTLEDMLKFLGDRKISLCRELTKMHEEVIRTTLSQAVEMYREVKPKGEFVLVVEGANESELSKAETIDDALAQVRALVDKGMRGADACKEIAKATGFSKGELYTKLLEQKE
jgi:16S rRNA (cytidine1402-2'-O)-methyltransferase